MLFDWLVVGLVVEMNPAAAVRGPKHVVKRRKTPVLEADEARTLLESIDCATPVGLRDRALIALLIYTFARVSAAIAMNVEDYYVQGRRSWVRVLTLIRTGTLSHDDFFGKRTYIFADGRSRPSEIFRIRSLKIGDRTLPNVIGSTAPV